MYSMVSSNQLSNPKQLKTLAFNVKYSKGNNLLHQFVLDNSQPNNLMSENDINAVLLSMCGNAVNALNVDGYSALHLAVLKNNVLMVKKLLSCLVNIDINTCCNSFLDENTALHLASKLGHLSVIRELLKKGADVDIKNKHGNTAICFGAESGDLNVIKLLVNKGANVNVRGRWAFPLHFAAESGNKEAVEFLLSNGADLNSRNKIDETVLHVAAKSGNLEIVEFLVSNGADLNAKGIYGNTMLHYAVKSGNLATVEFFISSGADVKAKNGYRQTPLFHAAKSGNLAILDYLVKKDAEGRTPFHSAASRKKREENVDRGTDLNGGGKIRLHSGAIEKSLENVAYLLDKGTDMRAIDEKKIVNRCNLETTSWIRPLIKGVYLNTPYKDGKTFLHDTMIDESENFTEMLIERDIDGLAFLHPFLRGHI